jgi:hypothetical protein
MMIGVGDLFWEALEKFLGSAYKFWVSDARIWAS